MIGVIRLLGATLLFTFLAACSSASATGIRRATVTDTSVVFASSEAEAVAPHGFMAYGAFGRLRIGCAVDVLKTTDRGAQVKFVSCPDFSRDEMTPTTAVTGWVAKSALDL